MTYGRARLRIAAGTHARVAVRLSRAGRRLLRNRRRPRVWANPVIGGTRLPGTRLTLRH